MMHEEEEGEEAGCPTAGWRMQRLESYFLANPREG